MYFTEFVNLYGTIIYVSKRNFKVLDFEKFVSFFTPGINWFYFSCISLKGFSPVRYLQFFGVHPSTCLSYESMWLHKSKQLTKENTCPRKFENLAVIWYCWNDSVHQKASSELYSDISFYFSPYPSSKYIPCYIKQPCSVYTKCTVLLIYFMRWIKRHIKISFARRHIRRIKIIWNTCVLCYKIIKRFLMSTSFMRATKFSLLVFSCFSFNYYLLLKSTQTVKLRTKIANKITVWFS